MSECKHKNLKCMDCFREVDSLPVWIGVDWATLGGDYSVEIPVPVAQPETKRGDNKPLPVGYPNHIGGMLDES